MAVFVLKNTKIFAEDTVIEKGFIRYSQEKILTIGPMDKFSKEDGEIVVETPWNGSVIPGMIDIHIHGSNGADVMDCSEEGLKEMAKSLVREGTTSFLATTMTQSPDVIKKALKTVADYIGKQDINEAEILGVHLEGPFINAERAGAQPLEYIVNPDIELFQEFQEASKGLIKIVTVAPEKENGLEFVKFLKEHHVIGSIGHSTATCFQAEASFEAGSQHITHFYNGLNPLHHREASVVGAALLHDEQLVEMIVDGIHIDPKVVALTYKVKGSSRILLVTDSMRAKYLPDGEYDLGGQKVSVHHGEARIETGSLAGSIIRMDVAMRNMMKFTNCSLSDIVKMTSENQARQIRLFERKGSIAPGKDADLVILDEEHNVIMTICRGNIAYKRK
jgi:N-acetylglucosamine-6-phosphate deacetylase